MQKETLVSRDIALLGAKDYGIITFRNNVGQGLVVTGKNRKKITEQLIEYAFSLGGGAFRIKYGLKNGSADKIGYVPRLITQEMVGQVIAQFVSVEDKTKTGVISKTQYEWADEVDYYGGVAIIAKGLEDFKFQADKKVGVIDREGLANYFKNK